MAIPFLSNIDLNKKQALNLVLHNKNTAPSTPADGQIYFNSDASVLKAYVYLGSAKGWTNIGGDIEGVDITAGAGLTGTLATTSGTHTQTLNVVGGDGITANADEIEVTVDNSTLELSATDGSGAVRIKDNGVRTVKIEDEAVTLAKIQHIATQKVLGRNTTGTGDVESLSPSDFRAFLKSALNGNLASVTFGDADDTITIPGNLVVTGTQTIQNETVSVVENNTIQFEGTSADDHEIKLTAANATDSDKTITLPNLSGHAALLAVAATETITSTPAELNILDGATVTTAELNIIDGNTSATSTSLVDADRVVVNDNGTMKQVAFSDVATYIEAQITSRELTVQLAASESAVTKSGNVYTVTHSFGTRNVLCQVIENNISGSANGTYQTVVVDVDRPSDTTVEVDFGDTVTDGDYRILIHKIG